MTEKTKKTIHPKRILIDDEKLQLTVIRRLDELLNKERPIAALIRKISAESGLSLASIRETVRAAKNGENMKLLQYTYFSKHFHFNLCNFFNPDMTNWDKEYTEIDEIENAFKRMARVIEYAKYSNHVLIRTNTVTNGDMYNVFSQAFCENFQLIVENGYDSDNAPKLSINQVVRLSALSNIPTYAFFMVDDDAFESILKENVLRHKTYLIVMYLPIGLSEPEERNVRSSFWRIILTLRLIHRIRVIRLWILRFAEQSLIISR